MIFSSMCYPKCQLYEFNDQFVVLIYYKRIHCHFKCLCFNIDVFKYLKEMKEN